MGDQIETLNGDRPYTVKRVYKKFVYVARGGSRSVLDMRIYYGSITENYGLVAREKRFADDINDLTTL